MQQLEDRNIYGIVLPVENLLSPAPTQGSSPLQLAPVARSAIQGLCCQYHRAQGKSCGKSGFSWLYSGAKKRSAPCLPSLIPWRGPNAILKTKSHCNLPDPHCARGSRRDQIPPYLIETMSVFTRRGRAKYNVGCLGYRRSRRGPYFLPNIHGYLKMLEACFPIGMPLSNQSVFTASKVCP